MTSMRLTTGEHYKLEAEANEWLRKGREGVTKLSEKKDYLTEEQLQLRWDREMPTQNLGAIENHGLYRRAYNPMAGKRRPGKSDHDA